MTTRCPHTVPPTPVILLRAIIILKRFVAIISKIVKLTAASVIRDRHTHWRAGALQTTCKFSESQRFREGQPDDDLVEECAPVAIIRARVAVGPPWGCVHANQYATISYVYARPAGVALPPLDLLPSDLSV
jgi:hypothetical protein